MKRRLLEKLVRSALGCLVLLTTGLTAQPVEQLWMPVGLPTVERPVLRGTASGVRAAKTLSTDTLSLPFSDDFSSNAPWKWADQKVQVASAWAVEARSVGQAVFDGINAYGRPYKMGSLGSDSLTDVLTSPYLDLRTRNNVVLTFLFQTGGLGDPTEPDDSLRVDFWNPTDSSWDVVWSRAGGGDPERWRWAAVPVAAPWAGQNGFRFRLAARGARGGAFDHWLVDHVFLGANRTSADTVLEDPAWTMAHPTLLKDYTEVPYWIPFYPVADQEYELEYRRNGPIPVGGWSLNLGKQVVTRGADTVFQRLVVPVVSNLIHNTNEKYQFSPQPAATSDTEPYTLASTIWFDGENVGILSNDSVHYRQRFENRYGWDDGSSERAYGVQNVNGGTVAMHTPMYRGGDTLRGIDLAFVPAGVDATQQGFRICVWAANNTQPGALLYRSDSVYTPDYSWGPDVLVHYVLDTVGLVLPNTVFLGWQQEGTAPMHVGYDVNSPPVVPNVYGEPGIWYTSLYQGRLRLRPFLNQLPLDLQVAERPAPLGALRLYPNPGRDWLRVEAPGIAARDLHHLEVFDAQGRVVFSGPYVPELATAQWSSGLYTLRLRTATGIFTARWNRIP